MRKSQVKALSIQVDRELGLRGSFYDFVKVAWNQVEPGVVFYPNWHIEAICNELEQVFLSDKPSNNVINIPPGCMKSLLCSVFYNAWCWIRNPGYRFIVASFDVTLTLRDAKRVLGLCLSQWFIDRWGDIVEIKEDPAASEFHTTAGGWRFSTSVDGKVTGRHADMHIVDDPIKPADLTKAALENVKEWHTSTMPSRFRDQKKPKRVLIMQRLHMEDLAGFCIGMGYHLVRFPMRFEKEYADPLDVRSIEGELLWPDRFPEEAVVALEEAMSVKDGARIAFAQLQQRPVPEGGAIFKREWFKSWEVLPGRFDQIIQSWDFAFKGKDTSDFVVGQVWGRRGGEFWLLDQVRGRWDLPTCLEQMRALTRKWPKAIAKLVEDKANGPAVVQSLRKEISGIIEVTPEGGKESRANAVAPLFEAGNVWQPDPKKCRWVDLHRDELANFPAASHDDTVDACSQALTYLHSRSSQFAAAMKVVQNKGLRLLT